jgi:hypothetical protein
MQAPVTPQQRQAAQREIVRQMEQGAEAQLARTHSAVPMRRMTVYWLLKRDPAVLCEQVNWAAPQLASWTLALFYHPFFTLHSSCAKISSNMTPCSGDHFHSLSSCALTVEKSGGGDEKSLRVDCGHGLWCQAHTFQ